MEPTSPCGACTALNELEPYEPSPVVVRLEIAKALIAADPSAPGRELAKDLSVISETVLNGTVPNKP